ncbi:MAG: S-methyl-5'-thioadenosine phosphorylase [Anaerolineae bacterium]|nr:S-methyl-5'-thioadenosine phosphorylase [Anaerolineae bacterium]
MNNPIAVGVIGGSGLYRMPGLKSVREVEITTPFGAPSDAIITGEVDGVAVAFLPRHGRGHVYMPTEVPYQANIYALKSLGVQVIISVSACGSLREQLRPGDVVIPDQVFDFTKLRKSSFFGEGQVAHISVADPYCPELSARVADAVAEAMANAGEAASGRVHRGGTFIAIEGPRFSTKAESRVFRAWGMDIIGMTVCPEVFLAREAGICYATIAHVTDFDVWHESREAVTVSMVIRQLNANVGLVQEALRRLIPQLPGSGDLCECAGSLSTALITDPARIPAQTKERLALLTGSDAVDA